MVERFSKNHDLALLKDQLYFVLDQLVYDNLPFTLEQIPPRPPSIVETDLVINIETISRHNKRVKALKISIYLDLGIKTIIQYRNIGLLHPRLTLTYDNSAISRHQHTPKFNTVVNMLSRELRKYGLRSDYIEVTHTLVRDDDEAVRYRLSRRPTIATSEDPATLPEDSPAALNHVVSVYYVPDKNE
jgi:hypothetical protein